MIVLPVHLNQLRLEVGADIREDGSQALDGVGIEYLATIFRHKDQVNVHLKNTMPSMPNIVFIVHRPKV